MLKRFFACVLTVFVFHLGIHAQEGSSPNGSSRSFLVDRVVAIVNEDAITMTDLQRSLVPLLKQLKSQYNGSELRRKLDEAARTVLEQLIDNKLILKTATGLQEKDELRIPEKEISKYVQKIVDRFPSKQVFEETLAQENLSFEDFKKDCIEQLLVKKLVSREVSAKVLVSNEDIKTYYNEHIKDYTSPEKISFLQIWLKKGQDEENKRKLIDELYLQIKKGADFKTLAMQHSEDPNSKEGKTWKNVEKGQFTEELDKALWSMTPGQVSNVIETSVGFHIIRVEVKEKPRIISLEEVWNEIQDNIYFERAESIRKEWLQRLRKDAYIQIFYEENNQ